VKGETPSSMRTGSKAYRIGKISKPAKEEKGEKNSGFGVATSANNTAFIAQGTEKGKRPARNLRGD